jgi:NADH oxidase (H2O2-forming)
LVIIGSGLAGVSAACAADECNDQADIVICSESEHVGFDPAAIPFILAGDVRSIADTKGKPVGFSDIEKRIRMYLEERVVAICPPGNFVETKNQKIEYDSLVIATGSHFLIPDVEGVHLRNVFTAKTLEDALRIKRALRIAKKATIYGAGPLGIEVAIALAKKGKDVILIEPNDHVFYDLIDSRIALDIQKMLEKRNIKICLGTKIEGFIGDRKVRRVRTAKGNISSDLVILATRTAPNTELAMKAGLKTNKTTGAICTNQLLQTNVNSIYAAGDCAEIQNAVTGFRIRCKLGSTAFRMGRVAGTNAAGGAAEFKKALTPWIVPLDGHSLGGVGCTSEEAYKAGYRPHSIYHTADTHEGYYSQSSIMNILLIVDRDSRKILGAQILGKEGVKERIDFLAYLIKCKVHLEDLGNIENCYAPNVASLIDPVVQTARIGLETT